MASKSPARYAVGIFRDWSELLIAVAALADEPEASQELSFVSRSELFDEPSLRSGISRLAPALQHAIVKRVTLAFHAPALVVSCSAGSLADQLARRVQQGSRSLADALGVWMAEEQAARVDDDTRQGSTLLWARMLLPGQELSTCETLLKSRPLRVEVHDLVPVSPVRVDPTKTSGNGSL